MLKNAFRQIFSFPAMLLTGLMVSPFFASLDVRSGGPVIRETDIWWHLRNAQMLLTTHHFIRQDLYSFTVHGQRWIDPEWLAEIPYYLGFHFLGERGLFLVMIAVLEFIIAGVFYLCYRRSGDLKAAFLATWVAVLFAAVNIGIRTILFGWLCFTAEMLILAAFRRGRNHLWLLVPLFALWINFHPSWAIGLVFFVLFMVSGWRELSWGSIEAVAWTPPQRRNLITVAIASIAALFVNPYGWRLVAYPFYFALRQQLNVALIEEWKSVNFQTFFGKLVFIVVAGMFVFTLARRRPWPLHELLFAMLAFYSGLTHERFLFLTGIVICPMLAIELEGAVFEPYDPKTNKPILSAAIMVGYLVFAFFHVPSTASLHEAEVNYFPVRALPALQASCADRHVFNWPEWGGYMIWNARNIPVFIDGRIDIFEKDGILADQIKALTINNSLAILDHYQIGCVLLSPKDALVYFLRNTPGWHVQYEDSTAALVVRDAEPAKPQPSPGEPKPTAH